MRPRMRPGTPTSWSGAPRSGPRSRRPPTARLIALAHPATEFEREPDVFIPVGQPGLDHAGLVFRANSTVGLHLKKYRDVGLVSVADAIKRIAEAGV